mmetsp:Transcript_27153/g.87289  ORF Transcript_27153/g.87289 Transcript_27153/m.87289 type:complete len:204 (+) Transcript_27153:1676-2287(+)
MQQRLGQVVPAGAARVERVIVITLGRLGRHWRLHQLLRVRVCLDAHVHRLHARHRRRRVHRDRPERPRHAGRRKRFQTRRAAGRTGRLGHIHVLHRRSNSASGAGCRGDHLWHLICHLQRLRLGLGLGLGLGNRGWLRLLRQGHTSHRARGRGASAPGASRRRLLRLRLWCLHCGLRRWRRRRRRLRRRPSGWRGGLLVLRLQ